jgi:transposase
VELDPAIAAGLPPQVIALISGLIERVERLEAENAALHARVAELEAENAALRSENTALKAEVAELKGRLNMDSSNSSKPPSSDGLKKPSRPKGERTRAPSRRKTGRPGKTRTDFGPPDRVEEVAPETCPDCQAVPTGPRVLLDRWQVAELVEKPFVVTEYQRFGISCLPCGKTVEPPPPPGILPGFSLGPRLTAFIGLLGHFANVTQNKMVTLFQEVFNLPICEGTINNANRLWNRPALAVPVQELKESLPQLEHVHGDETGWRINGVRHWAWILATASITFVFIAASRGAEVLKSLLGDAFTGLISCDFYNAYRAKDGVGGERTFCWAHLDREAKGVIENGWGDTAEFGRALRRIINKGYIHWRGLMRRRISVDTYQQLGERLKARMKEIVDKFEGKLVGDKPIALRKRLAENLAGYFNWYRFPGVPPDNSLAERAARPSVVKRKVSGGNRSQWGAEFTAYMQTVIGTCRKQGRPLLDTLVACLLAYAHGDRPYPSLMPADPADAAAA